jgi:hypothetical protein
MKAKARKVREEHEQFELDHERVRELAFGAVADGLRFEPEQLLELLFIVIRNEDNRDALIQAVAEETYPLGVEGSAAIEKMIERAKKGGGQ